MGGLVPNSVFVVIRDIITYFKFGDDKFRGLVSAECQISPFSIDFDGRPCNTHKILCERVMKGLAADQLYKIISSSINKASNFSTVDTIRHSWRSIG